MSLPNPDGTNKVRSINWMKVSPPTINRSRNTTAAYLPRPCMQWKPSCVSVCTVVATDNEGRRHRQPDSSPLHRLPVLHGLMPRHARYFQSGALI